jgi:type II secretory pathway pseudopilin PulG
MEYLSPFKRQEKKVLLGLFIVLAILTAFNMNISIRRGRDNQRKNDMSTLQKALDLYHGQNFRFPKSVDGKIAACMGPVHLGCQWGKDKFMNISTLPRDPSSDLGREYLYLSNTKGYAIYIALEGKDEAEYTQSILDMGLHCGSQICNYGREYNFQ